MKNYDFCVVGSGPAGLTLTYKLLQAGKKVLLLERDKRSGGLAKSYDINGHIFDTGPKRFHTDDQKVLDFIHQVGKENLITIGRSTKVFFENKYHEWPLKAKSILSFPKLMGIKCFLDLIKKREIKDPNSFQDYIESKYGTTLYKVFFEPYTSKFLRWDPSDLHSDWATTGINRSVIDKRIKTNALADLFKSLILPQKVDTTFLYPKQGGFGGFFDSLFRLCNSYEELTAIFSDKITELEKNGQGFRCLTQLGRTISFDQLVWTGNLNNLYGIITKQNLKNETRLNYLNTLFYNIIIKESEVQNHRAQWIYISSGKTLISRLTCMKEFTDYTCKDGYYNVIAEVTDSQVKPKYFYNPKDHTSKVIDELIQLKFLKKREGVESIHINKIQDTYPIYHKSYLSDFEQVKSKIIKYSENIHLLGRLGAYWYNNSDHSIRMALEMATKLIDDEKHCFDYRGYFGNKVTSKGIQACC